MNVNSEEYKKGFEVGQRDFNLWLQMEIKRKLERYEYNHEQTQGFQVALDWVLSLLEVEKR